MERVERTSRLGRFGIHAFEQSSQVKSFRCTLQHSIKDYLHENIVERSTLVY